MKHDEGFSQVVFWLMCFRDSEPLTGQETENVSFSCPLKNLARLDHNPESPEGGLSYSKSVLLHTKPPRLQDQLRGI